MGAEAVSAVQQAPLLRMTAAQTTAYFVDALRKADVRNVDALDFACREVAIGTQPRILSQLEDDWYRSVYAGQPDYSVYDVEQYLAEAFNCWWGYSRTYLKAMLRKKSLPPNGIMADFADVRLVVDLGNGVGLTTAALTQLFPNAEVVATNVPGSPQYRVAELMADAYGFSMVPDAVDVAAEADLVWASEYFEHFYEPVEHLRHIIGYLSPTAMLTANTFTGRATGHFDTYEVDGELFDGNGVGRAFGDEMRTHGYSKVDTGLWNNKPAYWRAS